MNTPAIIDLDRIVMILAARHRCPAHVEHTGGGIATIYAGDAFTGEDGDLRYPAIAGPGWFATPVWQDPRASLAEFYIGADDDGDGEVTQPPPDATEDDVATLIANQVTAHS